MNFKKSFFLALVLMVLLGGAGLVSRARHLEALQRDAKEASVQQVMVFSPSPESSSASLALPGDVRGYRDTSIYSRSAGYLGKWYADIGSEVKEGDPIAKIESPELDAQVRQAKADLSTAKANYDLAEKTALRWTSLSKTKTVSEQDLENKLSDAAAKKATLDSAGAKLSELQALQAFELIRAPFSGTVTARNVDVGDLVTAAPSGRELFHMVKDDRLRIYVQVPQVQAGEVKEGMQAQLSVPEHPGRQFMAKVERNAGALDLASRTVQVELLFENRGHELKAGDFATVSFPLKESSRVTIPITALIFRGEGLQVASVRHDHRVHLLKVVPGRDFGKSMEILSGIDRNTLVIDNPADSILEGQEVSFAKQGAK
ncbi:MAG: efflux RND transporter periplasmic adaptor subunit [Burkholderiales bacterium]|nr:efflux RND transporter periplasmic adaptor subunit [Burkholderiales bacterium]